jgi:hypothetical protein
MGNCAGVDWAGEKHDVRVGDEVGEELLVERLGFSWRLLRE